MSLNFFIEAQSRNRLFVLREGAGVQYCTYGTRKCWGMYAFEASRDGPVSMRRGSRA